jgi:hypothetical protein
MKKLTTLACAVLFALAGTAAHAADDKKKPEPAKAKTEAAKPADKAASAAKPASAPVTAKKKEKKGGC